MSRRKRRKIEPRDVRGLKYLEALDGILDRLHTVGTERDRAGNRKLFCDQYVMLLLLRFFNPVLAGLRSLQQASELEKVQKVLGGGRVSLGSLSEAGSVFDPEPVAEIIRELAGRAVPVVHGEEASLLRHLTAVDGSIFRAASRASWALWMDQKHRGVKLHLHLSVFEAIPRQATVTPAACSETAVLRMNLEPNRLYVADRGYQDYAVLRAILDAGSSFIVRVKRDQTAHEILEKKEISAEAAKAGVVFDYVLNRLGTSHHKNEFAGHTLRLIGVAITNDQGEPDVMWLLTDRLDLPAEVIAVAYRYRWTVELFFRWFKHIVGCLNLISTKEEGITIQLYVALIASLLIVLWTGLKPNRRAWEMVQLYLMGVASLAELQRHIEASRKKQAEQEAKKKKS